MSKTEIPSIRFCGFENAWEQRKLSELIIEYKETVGSDCTLPILTSSKTEGIILQEEHFGRKQNHDITGYNILPRNYCTYRNRSDGVDFTFNINRCCDKGIISKFYPVFCGNNSDIFFISLVLNNSDEVIREIGYTCTGTGQKVLSFGDLQEIKIRVPKYEEQKRIASYIEALDNFISLHRRKYEKLQALKASMLEKMFPQNGEGEPEVRFKGFVGAWQKTELCKIANKVTEKNVQNLVSETFTNSAEHGIISQRDFFDHDISNAEKINGYYIVQDNDFVYNPRVSVTAPCGPVNRNRLGRKGVMSPLYTVFRTHDIDPLFLEWYFQSPHWYAYMRFNGDSGARSDRFSIKNELFFQMPIPFPDIEEQFKIGQALQEISNSIKLHQQELDKLQSVKKALLEKMFV